MRTRLSNKFVFCTPFMKFKLTVILLLSSVLMSFAQEKNTLDKVVAIVGERIVLQSEIALTMVDMQRQYGSNMPDNVQCDVLEQILGQKILAEQAERDSVIVSEDEVEGTLDNRIRYFIQRFGSEEKMVEVTGKTIFQLKDEYRPIFKEQLAADRMQQQIISVVKITPQEVKKFYDGIPQDSLPFYPSAVEMGQIVFAPKVHPDVEDYARKKLEGIRTDIINGVNAFDVMAGIYSEDPGSRDNGGDLGYVSRGDLVAEFASAGFRLQKGEISDVVKTDFGFHIIQMMDRKGEKAQLRHILIKPQITSADIKKAENLADSVRAELMAGKMTFSQAVNKFSSDKSSKLTGGMITNPQTEETSLDMDQLDASMLLSLQDLEPGQYGKPSVYTSQTGDQSVRILYLKTKTEPHKANLKDDYYKIQQVALNQKQQEYLFNWLVQHIPSFYVKIDEAYNTCPNISKWMTKTQN